MTATAAVHRSAPFRHEAFLYRGEADFVAGTSAYLREGLAEGAAALVVVERGKIGALEEALGDDRDRVSFADMSDVGRNPARIIPLWRRFVDEHVGRPVRGVGEPVWWQRSPTELAECQHHETLLNLAFAGPPAWSLLCPYDVESLPADVIEAARRNHPYVLEAGCSGESDGYRGDESALAVLDGSLPEPAGPVADLTFSAGSLTPVRTFVKHHATAAGLDRARAEELVFAVNELASNALRHGGGRGTVRLWCDDGSFVCEVRDGGRIHDPLVGRAAPGTDEENGRGLWLVNQLCDLVQLRSGPGGTVVRLHMGTIR